MDDIGGGTGGGSLVPVEIWLDALHDAEIAGSALAQRASAGIGDGQTNVVVPCLCINMGRVLLAGGCAVAKIPGPGGDGALSGNGLIGELNGGGGAREGEVGGELGGRGRVNSYVIGFTHGVSSAAISGDERNSICAGCRISDGGILEGGALAVTKIPVPGGGGICREVFERNAQRTAAGCGGSGKVGAGSLRPGYGQSKQTEAAKYK